jgi:hypothetical protein
MVQAVSAMHVQEGMKRRGFCADGDLLANFCY